ncbi:MAG: ATP-binding protein, partial [Syntrophothermus sp.]
HKRRFESRTVETHFIREMTLWNGSVIWVEVTNSYLDFEDHRTLLLSIFRDVTARKQDELKLNNYAAELAALNATKDKFFSIIAHDLRGPINSLVSLSGLAIEDFDSLPHEEVKFYMENINGASKRIVTHLENLLHWSRLNSGRMPFNPEKINLCEIADNTVAMVIGNAVGKNVEINNNISDGCYAFADKNMITSVVQNLISNAIKFTSAGGHITLSSSGSDNHITVCVTDTGIGISPDNIEKLFRIDVHHTTIGTGNEKGSGLGLILCNELIKRNGGTIRVESEKGKGSSFIFTLEKYAEQP